jgi:general stress protein YciG
MPRPKPDFTQVAHAVFQHAINGKQHDDAAAPAREVEESQKASAGRKGGKKGGPARSEKLDSARRSEIARKAATARWTRKIKQDR